MSRPRTLGALKAAGYRPRSLKDEIRENLIALLRSGALLLEHIGQPEPARRIEQAVRQTLERGEGLTRDLGGTGTTATLKEEITRNL